MRALVLFLAGVLLAAGSAGAAQLELTVRGTPWILATNTDAGSCTPPRQGDPSGVYYECWDKDGSRAVANPLTGCVETSGRGWCGPKSAFKAGTPGMVLLCPDGKAWQLAASPDAARCWTRVRDGVTEGSCGSGLAYVTSDAIADCHNGCSRSDGAGSCTLLETTFPSIEARGKEK